MIEEEERIERAENEINMVDELAQQKRDTPLSAAFYWQLQKTLSDIEDLKDQLEEDLKFNGDTHEE